MRDPSLFKIFLVKGLKAIYRRLPGQIKKYFLSILRRPVNYQKRCVASIDKNIEHAIRVGTNYLKIISESGVDIAGKTLLELGPGINFGSTLYLSAFGARVMVVDRFLAAWDDEYHSKFYARLAARLKEHIPHADTSALDRIISCHGYPDDAIGCFETAAEDLSVIADGTIDIVLSSAVLEHIMDPLRCFQELFRVMSPQGIQIHEVDFRDHDDFSRPLDFLLIGDEEYERIFKEVHAERGNRLRPTEYETLMRQAGFSNISINPLLFAEEAYLEEFMDKLPNALASRYHSFAKSNLRQIVAYFILK